jgi:hypothetical protein
MQLTPLLFEESRRQQQHYVQTAEIQRNLRQTTQIALSVLSTLAERGETLDKQEQHANLVMESSEEMAKQAEVIRGAGKGWRAWLCCWCCWNGFAVPSAVPSAVPKAVPKPPPPKKRVFQFSK